MEQNGLEFGSVLDIMYGVFILIPLIIDHRFRCRCRVKICPSTSLDVNSSQDSEEMGQIGSRISKLLLKKEPETSTVVPDEEPEVVITSYQVDITVGPPDGGITYPLATPRSPLRRERPSTPSETTPEKPPLKRLKEDVQYLDFPMLRDEKTISFILNSKVIFIMKGLQGSGKSFIVSKLKEVYKKAVACSADYYFMMDGEYKFDKDHLKEAHEYCQDEATRAAAASCNVIIIDNTNVRNWEMKFYLDLAKEYRYIPLVVEPRTPWAKDPSELSLRNSHDLTEEFLASKVKAYQPLQPLYYAWFLNELDSEKICKIGHDWLRQALSVPEFFKDMSENLQVFNHEEILHLFSRNSFVDGGNIVHATAKFTGRGKSQEAKDYSNSSVVNAAMGKAFSLHIIGFVFTPRTIGARLKLTDEELLLWGNVDDEVRPPKVTPPTVPQKNTWDNWNNVQDALDNGADVAENPEDVPDDQNAGKPRFLKNKDKVIAGCECTVTAKDAKLTEDRFCPTTGKGSRAHLTLACAPGVKPVNTGFDLIDVVRCEQRLREGSAEQKLEVFPLNGGVLRNYGEGTWVMYPEKETVVSSLFSALN